MHPGQQVRLTGTAWADLGLQGLTVTITRTHGARAYFHHHGVEYWTPTLDYTATPT